MAVINAAILQALRSAYRDDFQKALEGTPHDWDKVAMRVPSINKSNTYGWLGQFPQFREWVGARVIADIKEHGYQILNKTWESTVGVIRDDIEDDNFGVYSPLFAEMGRGAASHPDELVFALLAAGNTSLCYDGQFFFDTDHPVYPNADGTGAAATVSNDLGGLGTAWYLLDTSRAVKPIIYQERRAPELVARVNLNDESVFTDNEFQFGASIRSNVGFGLWQLAVRSGQALDATNYAAARQAMREFKADGGRPLGIRPTTLVVPPSLEKAAFEVLKAERDAAGATNVYAGTAELVVSDWLA